MIDELWDYSDAAGSRERFEAALAQEQDRGKRFELKTQIARTHGLEGDFDAGHRILDDFDPTAIKGVVAARYWLERGRLFRSSGDPESGIPCFEQALEFADGKFDFYTVDAMHMLGIVTKGDKSIAWNIMAADTASKSDDERTQNWAASLQNNLGWSFHDDERLDEALACFEKALVLREKQGNPKTIGIAHWCIARCYRSLGRLEEALAYQTRLLNDKPENNGYGNEEVAECLLALGRAEEAKPYFAAAHAVLIKDGWLVQNESARLERLQTLSQ